MNKENGVPMVDVCMDTYNHEPFIGQAIESILMQKTSFPFRLVIGEDFSLDDTREICKMYARMYPGKVVLLETSRNLGQNENKHRTMRACTAKYVALCEGDDYWTDPLKLQKQVDFLESHPDFVMCFHKINAVNRFGKILLSERDCGEIKYYDGQQMLHVFVPTMSLVYRNCIREFPDEYFRVKSTDAFLVGMLAKYGKGADLGFVAGAYRKYEGGLYNSLPPVRKYGQALVTRRWMCKSSYFDSILKSELRREFRRRYVMYMKSFLKRGEVMNCIKLNMILIKN